MDIKHFLINLAVILYAGSTCSAMNYMQKVLIPDEDLPTIFMNSGSGRVYNNRVPGGVGDVFNAGSGEVTGNTAPCSRDSTNPTSGNVNTANIFNSGTGIVAKNGR